MSSVWVTLHGEISVTAPSTSSQPTRAGHRQKRTLALARRAASVAAVELDGDSRLSEGLDNSATSLFLCVGFLTCSRKRLGVLTLRAAAWSSVSQLLAAAYSQFPGLACSTDPQIHSYAHELEPLRIRGRISDLIGPPGSVVDHASWWKPNHHEKTGDSASPSCYFLVVTCVTSLPTYSRGQALT